MMDLSTKHNKEIEIFPIKKDKLISITSLSSSSAGFYVYPKVEGGEVYQYHLQRNYWTFHLNLPLDEEYLTANFDKKFALVWDKLDVDWVYLDDFSTGSLFKHGPPANLIFFNWKNFNYPTKTFQHRVYVWAVPTE